MISEILNRLNSELTPHGCRLIAVSKTQPVEKLKEAYQAGQRLFGENKVQELPEQYAALPTDIERHMIGHLQRNKVKYIAPFVGLIHSVDSLRLLEEINKQGEKNQRIIPCLLQVHIATEESKFGFDREELLTSIPQITSMKWIKIKGLMGMATFTDNQDIIRKEFKTLKKLFEEIKSMPTGENISMEELSMGMSGDYQIALEEGSTLVRIGTTIFGARNYPTIA
ncbi:MAG: YggS family pyridoxal phosphate-dependent enzyme [Cyclobacteriaceae bacterium]